MAFLLETEVHLGIIMLIMHRSVKFLLLIYKIKTKTIIKISSPITHSRRCNSNLLSREERIFSRGKDSWITKLITQWTSRTKNTTKTGHLYPRTETTHPLIKRLCHPLRSQKLLVLLWTECQSTAWKKMCLAMRQYKIVITIITTWASRTVITSLRTPILTCKISWTEMTRTSTQCRHLKTMKPRSQVWTRPTLRARTASRSQSISKTTW